MSKRRKWIIGAAGVVVVAFFGLPWLFDARPSTRLSDGVTVKVADVIAAGTVPSRWGRQLQRILPHTVTPRWVQSKMFGSHPFQHTLWLEAKGSGPYVCTVTGPNGETFGPTTAAPAALHLNGLRVLTVDEFPPTSLMAIHFYKAEGLAPLPDPGQFVKPERFLGTLTVPTPMEGRIALLATNRFPAQTNFADVEVSVEKVEIFQGPLYREGREWKGRAYLGFRENGVLSTNWDTAWFSQIKHHRGSFPLSGAKAWTDGLREIYFSSADFPERGWKIRADIVRKKNFPESELMLITNVPAPGSADFPADWETATNWNGSLVTLKAMREISFSVSGGTRAMQPPTPGLVAMTLKDSGLVPRIARVEADTGELLHDPVNRWSDEWTSIPWSTAMHAPGAKQLRVWLNVQRPRRIELAGVPDRLTNTPALSH